MDRRFYCETSGNVCVLLHDGAVGTDLVGVRLHYAQAGSGKLMLFLHGFPEFWYAWRSQLEEFGRDHLAVAPDLRSYNLSDRPQDVKAYRAKVLIEDVRQLAAQLTSKRFVLVGHDWGGALAWAFAAAHPQLLERLVIVNAPHPVPFARDLAHDEAQQQASRYMNLFRDAKAERVLSENGYARLLLKCLTIIDEFTRECLAIDVAGSIRSKRVIEILARLISAHGAPRYLRSDNGPEFIRHAILEWLAGERIETALIDPGKPWQNVSVRSSPC